jgi:Fe2+ or Zn2+ uptake regulation protein
MSEAPVELRLAEQLRARGLRATPQRLLIHRVIAELGRHATAEEIHQAVERIAPNVSLPTTYATLELLEQLGLVRRLAVPGGSALYDPRGGHHHAVCRSCGRVADLEAEVDTSAVEGAARHGGFEPDRVEVVASGLCAECASGASERAAR